MPDFTEIIYIVDPNDHLVEVSRERTELPLKNDGVGIPREGVVGQSLGDFITDDPTWERYEAVLEHVGSGETTDLMMRYDVPDRRRLIEAIETRPPDGNVEFKSVLLASKPRAAQRLSPGQLRVPVGAS